jgi:hypothetical protein
MLIAAQRNDSGKGSWTMKAMTTTIFAVMLVLGACAKKDDTVAPATGTQGAYPQNGYAQPGATGTYPQQYAQPSQPGYAQPTQPGYPTQPVPTATPAPTTPGAATGGTMATPGPLALPCQNDSACGLAHCNTQFSKCAFPCQGPADCIQGAACNPMTGLCLPGGGK